MGGCEKRCGGVAWGVRNRDVEGGSEKIMRLLRSMRGRLHGADGGSVGRKCWRAW
jgi:hypothetical protein